MNSNFTEYINSLEMSDIFKGKVETTIKNCNKLFELDFNKLFISNGLDSENIPYYDSLFLFNENYVIEAKNFESTINFDIANLENNLHYAVLKSKNNDLDNFDDKSQLEVTMFQGDNLYTKFISRGKFNSECLIDIYKSIILKRI